MWIVYTKPAVVTVSAVQCISEDYMFLFCLWSAAVQDILVEVRATTENLLNVGDFRL
jgi:hypothetical protein